MANTATGVVVSTPPATPTTTTSTPFATLIKPINSVTLSLPSQQKQGKLELFTFFVNNHLEGVLC